MIQCSKQQSTSPRWTSPCIQFHRRSSYSTSCSLLWRYPARPHVAQLPLDVFPGPHHFTWTHHWSSYLGCNVSSLLQLSSPVPEAPLLYNSSKSSAHSSVWKCLLLLKNFVHHLIHRTWLFGSWMLPTSVYVMHFALNGKPLYKSECSKQSEDYRYYWDSVKILKMRIYWTPLAIHVSPYFSYFLFIWLVR